MRACLVSCWSVTWLTRRASPRIERRCCSSKSRSALGNVVDKRVSVGRGSRVTAGREKRESAEKKRERSAGYCQVDVARAIRCRRHDVSIRVMPPTLLPPKQGTRDLEALGDDALATNAVQRGRGFDQSMNGQESLGLTRRLEPSYWPFTLPRRLVRDFGSMVSVRVGVVDDGGHDLAVSGASAVYCW